MVTYAAVMSTSGRFGPSKGSYQEGSCSGTGFTGLTEHHEVKLSVGTRLVRFHLAKNDVSLMVPGRHAFEAFLARLSKTQVTGTGFPGRACGCRHVLGCGRK